MLSREWAAKDKNNSNKKEKSGNFFRTAKPASLAVIPNVHSAAFGDEK